MGLLQKELATELDIDKTTVSKWERNVTTPALHLYPRIIRFLGYAPFEDDGDASLGGRVRAYRRLNGLTQKIFGDLLGVDESTIRTWESGRNRPSRRSRKRLEELLRAVPTPTVPGRQSYLIEQRDGHDWHNLRVSLSERRPPEL